MRTDSPTGDLVAARLSVDDLGDPMAMVMIFRGRPPSGPGERQYAGSRP